MVKDINFSIILNTIIEFYNKNVCNIILTRRFNYRVSNILKLNLILTYEFVD